MFVMKRILAKVALVAMAVTLPTAAQAQLEGRWRNAKGSVIVEVDRCGQAFCGTVSWASPNNREKGAAPGTRVLTDLRPQGAGVYRGQAFEPKRNLRGPATVRQAGPNVMIVRGCVIGGILCKEQRWMRVG
jgi:uncharacterized protein (DUF2147 family)